MRATVLAGRPDSAIRSNIKRPQGQSLHTMKLFTSPLAKTILTTVAVIVALKLIGQMLPLPDSIKKFVTLS